MQKQRLGELTEEEIKLYKEKNPYGLELYLNAPKSKRTRRLLNLRPKRYTMGSVPVGRPPKEISLSKALKDFLRLRDEGLQIPRKDALLRKVYDMAMGGDINAMRIIFNYVDGLPKQLTEMSVTLPNPILGGQATKVIEVEQEERHENEL